MGAVYIAVPGPEDEQEKLDIVDGQQRFASFQLLIKALNDNILSLKEEARDQGKHDLVSELTEVEVKLEKGYSGTEPSVKLNSEDREFFAALAAYPENWYIDVRDFLVDQIDKHPDITGRNRPRAKTIEELAEAIQEPIQFNGDDNLTDDSAFEADKDGDEDAKLGKHVRFLNSHERMLEAYSEAYELIETLQDEETNGELAQRAYITMNFSSFVLHAIAVDRCLITEPNPDLRLDIFQSINDKGLALHDVDKIRARIKHRLVGSGSSGVMEEWRETLARFDGDKDDIKEMLKYFVAAKEDSVNKISEANNAVMQVFDRSTPERSNVTPLLTQDNAENLVTEVSTYSKYYDDLYQCEFNHFDRSIDDNNRKEVKRILNRVGKKIEAEQWQALGPFVYMMVDQGAPEDYDEEDIGNFLFEVFDAIEVLTLRQSISDHSGEAIEGVYVNAVQNFNNRSSDQFDATKIVLDIVEDASNQTEDLFEDGMIYHAVKNRNWTSSDLGRCILQRTTSRYLKEEDMGLEVRDYSDVDVEHILPQTPISDEAGRSASSSEPGKYAWLDYFFRVNETDEDSQIAQAIKVLKDQSISSLQASDVDSDDLGDEVNEDEILNIQEEVFKRFVDDIANLLILVNQDNQELGNKLLSKKLPVYWRDTYIKVIINDFFSNEENSPFIESEYVNLDTGDVDEIRGEDHLSDDIAEQVDRSWTYEVMFERKVDMVHQILKRLTFNLEPDSSGGDRDESVGVDKSEFDGLRDQIKAAVDDDRERRISRRNF
ncbi:Protein of unknown function [Halomicrobium zhouii]|uniref:GmrSD restriction endonucleases N-terminal domain-containing protein n=2 Tax=Halomicrobium zhouii TaxID=767519 RepID=A0A1I6L2H0_9EURY|nr:Protein of unknown function [Halomicrobium zhouii]